jgi:hypothetical protein
VKHLGTGKRDLSGFAFLFAFALPHSVPGTPTAQTEWRYCHKCQVMFYDGYREKGRCPPGGAHVAKGYNFVLPHFKG